VKNSTGKFIENLFGPHKHQQEYLHLPDRRSPSLHPPVLARVSVQLISCAVLAGKLIASLGQGNIDDPLAPLVLVKNDLAVIGSSFCSAGKDIRDIDHLLRADNFILRRQ